MADTSELSTLVVRNIADLELAVVHLESMDTQLLDEVGQTVRRELEAGEWHVHADAEDVDIWFAPRAWLTPDSDPVEAEYRFALEEQNGPDGGTDTSWVAESLQAGPTQALAAFYMQGETFGAKRRWRTLLGANREVVDRLLAAGFRQDADQKLFLPLLLDAQALATGFASDDLGVAMQPVRDALDVIAVAREDLDALVRSDREAA